LAIATGPILRELKGALPSELHALGSAVDARVAEFVAGRTLARHAAAALGIALAEVGIGGAGEPVWPAGLVGSISHTRSRAAAAIATSAKYRSVGLDLDDPRPLGSAAALVSRPPERAAVITAGWAASDEDAARVVFCLKEAIYKCQYSLIGVLELDFSEVEVTATGAIRPNVRPTGSAAGPLGTVLQAMELDWVMENGRGIALATVRQ
jgi:4'-phosphopantetheinyl transferase EntD